MCHTDANMYVPWFASMFYLHLKKMYSYAKLDELLTNFYNHKITTPSKTQGF